MKPFIEKSPDAEMIDAIREIFGMAPLHGDRERRKPDDQRFGGAIYSLDGYVGARRSYRKPGA